MFNIYVTKNSVEDSYTEGELGNYYTSIYNSKINSAKSLNDCFIIISDYMNCKLADLKTAIELDNDNNAYILSRLENDYGEAATEDEIKKWKENKYRLYSAYYSFTITEENEVQLKKIN